MGYCARVRLILQTFDAAEKRLALALNVRVTWTPEQPLAIEGTIPIGETVPVSLWGDQCPVFSQSRISVLMMSVLSGMSRGRLADAEVFFCPLCWTYLGGGRDRFRWWEKT
jgi:hypothetical protein